LTKESGSFAFGSSNIFWALGKPDSLNWRSHLLFLVPALSTALFFDSVRLGGPLSYWLLVSAAGFLATVISIELLSKALRKQHLGKLQTGNSGVSACLGWVPEGFGNL
jgi:hypothetical protein